ncbi:MAG: TraR/DksA family transcriptional regulator [Deltaproteobacteria bacterium]|nr:TraR/DksA family transcriptional regulator [Deltaproteobacteria bacterium]
MSTTRTKKTDPKSAAALDSPAPLANPEAELSAAQLRELQQLLIDERKRLREGLKRHVGEATETRDGLSDEGDQASHAADQAYLLRFADKEYKLLREVEAAIGRMQTGEYGICEGNGEPIGYKRLRLRPWTRYSVSYKEEVERDRAERRKSTAGN